jgi:hypothetical protein
MVGEQLVEWNECQGKPKYLEETCTSDALSTRDPEWSDSRSNPGRCNGKPATNLLWLMLLQYSFATNEICNVSKWNQN